LEDGEMSSINRVNGYSKVLEYANNHRKVKGVTKDEKNRQQDSQKRESFKDVFERTQPEEEKKK
jgi:hypothetical protein